MMEGRWTIYVRGWGHLVAPTDPKDVSPGPWPVVPCDDAAIDRAIKALGTTFAWDDDTGVEIVTMVLRAAGETP